MSEGAATVTYMSTKTAPTTPRVVRFCVDTQALTPEQTALFERHAGTARAVWNWALALRGRQHDALMQHVRAESDLQTRGDSEAAAELLANDAWRKAAIKEAPDELRIPLKSPTLGRVFTAIAKDPSHVHAPWAVDDRPDRFTWWTTEKHGVNRFAISTALRDLDNAFDRYYKNTGGHRAATRRKPRKDGRAPSWPRFKRRTDGHDAFSLYNLVVSDQDPWRVVDDAHRIKVPSLGSIRVHENTKRLRRLIKRGGRATCARFTRHGGRWYISITVSVPAASEGMVLSPTGAELPTRPTRSQLSAGMVGVDLGVKTLATLSNGESVANARHGRAAARKLARLQQALARQQGPAKGKAPSAGWLATKAKIGALQHRTAVRRRSTVHELTKRLATGFAIVGIEDLNVKGMTGTPAAKPDPDRPGAFIANGAAAKSGLNRSILDVGFGEFRRQLDYKTSWYGSRTIAVARFAPTSKTCSTCGAVKPKLRLSERTYQCDECGLVIDRDLNAAINIARLAGTTSPADAGDEKRPTSTTLVPAEAGTGQRRQDLGGHSPPRSQRRATDLSPQRHRTRQNPALP